MADRTILHCDCNGFYASVESILQPELRQVPMAVCGDPESRHGIILAKNELAKGYGIQTAETIWQAKRKCPDLVLVAPHREEYTKYSRLVNRIYQEYTDLVEPFGIDESWLDVTGTMHLFGSGPEIADTLRRRVREELGLTISVGVSFCKVFAKLGSDYKKPDATTVFDRTAVPKLVWPMPVTNLLFVGKASALTLRSLNIFTIGDLAQADPAVLERHMGKIGHQLHTYAAGLDESPVASIYEEKEVKSVGNGMTFRRDLTGIEDIRLGVGVLADSVAGRMRRHGLLCNTVQVTIRDPSFRSISRQKRLENPTHLASVLTETAIELIAKHWDLREPIRMITVTAQNLVPAEDAVEQMMLFDQPAREKRAKQEKLETAMDAIRQRFGQGAIKPLAVLDNDLGISEGGITQEED